MPRRCSVGARFSSTGCSWMTSSRMSHTTGVPASTNFFAALMVVAMPIAFQTAEDEGLEQLKRHQLRQAALVQLERRADDDDRTARVVDALAQQVLAEAAALALIMSASDFSARLLAPVMALPRRPLSSSASTASCSMRFSLRTMISGAFSSSRRQAVVAVDDAAVQVVQVAGREAAAVQRHQRTQVRRQHRQHLQDHPLGLMPDFLKASSTFRRLAIFLIFSSEPGHVVAQLLDLDVDVDRTSSS